MSGSHRSGGHGAAGEGYEGYRGPGDPYDRADYYPRPGSGSHRIVHSRPPRRRLALVVVGAVIGVSACILAVFVVLGSITGGDERGGVGTNVAGSGRTGSAPGVPGEVPDACGLISQQLADRLTPGADRSQSNTYQANDRANQCVWGAYTGDNKRLLTVEVRSVQGARGGTGAEAARREFGRERDADQSGDGMRPGQELTDKGDVADLGDEAYTIYALDRRQGSGEAVVNARQGNVLITVHYSGGDDGKALSADAATDGAVAAAREAAEKLTAGG